jgi:erythromycin esterase
MPNEPQGDGPPASVRAAIEDAITELETVDPHAPLTDLDAVDRQIEGATVVGLGEPSHGTKDVFRFKHRLFRYLVEEFDCRLFAIEANFSDALSLNEYVTGGPGTAEELLMESDFHGPWKCDAVLDLVEWIRSFNETYPNDQIRFHGFDMQHNSQTASMLTAYLDDVDPDALADVADSLAEIETTHLEQPDEDEMTAYANTCEHVASTLGARFTEQESAYVEQTSQRAFERARHQVRLIEQASQQFGATGEDDPPGENLRVRDEAMAENIAWLLEYESEEMVAVWAHNAHIKRGAVAGGLLADVASMGEALATDDTVDYVPIGYSIAQGEVRSFSPETEQFETYPVPEPPEESLPGVLATTSADIGYLDMTKFPADSDVVEWFESEPPRYAIMGAAQDDDPVAYVESNPWTDFDGLVFIGESTAATGLDGY